MKNLGQMINEKLNWKNESLPVSVASKNYAACLRSLWKFQNVLNLSTRLHLVKSLVYT